MKGIIYYLLYYSYRTYGLVYKAIHKETSQVVAIKQFKESDEDEQVMLYV